MRKLFCLILLSPFMFACSKNTSYVGDPLLTIEYEASESMIEVGPKFLYEKAFVNKQDSIFFIGDNTCAACAELKPKIESWISTNHGRIYYVPYQSIDEDNIAYLSDATVGYYQWTSKSSVPAVYFFTGGEVKFCGNEKTTIKYLERYVAVLQ